MPTLDPRQLRVFLSVCRQGSISGAARELNMAQPSVSVAISQLERTLGTRLFARSRTGIVLDRAGHALRRRAEAMETLLSEARREIDLLGQHVSGPLTIGGTPGALASLVPDAVARLRAHHPKVDIRILERSDAVLVDLLRNGRIDLAVVTTGIDPLPDDLIEEAILRDPFTLVVGRQNDTLPDAVSLSAVAHLPWVLPDAVGAFRRQLDALFISAQTPLPADVIRCDSLLTTKAIVRKSRYVTILPHDVVAPELAIGVLRAIRLEGVTFQRSVGIRRLGGTVLTPVAEAFLEACRTSDHP